MLVLGRFPADPPVRTGYHRTTSTTKTPTIKAVAEMVTILFRIHTLAVLRRTDQPFLYTVWAWW